MRKVLLVAYHFPPMGGGGVLRALKFAKYLPQNGYRPIVLTADRGGWFSADDSLTEGDWFKKIPVFRVSSPAVERLIRVFTPTKRDRSAWDRLRAAYYRLKYFMAPDPMISWYFRSKRIALEIAKREKIDIVYTTSPPHSEHLMGIYLKENADLPWVADFRDAFVGDPNLAGSAKGKIKRSIFSLYEKKILAHCDHVVTATNPIRDDFIRRFGSGIKTKVTTITNGFDGEDFPMVDRRRRNDRFTITYTGAFLGKRSPYYFIKALKALLIEYPEVRGLIRVILAGTFLERDRALFRDLMLRDVLTIKDFVSYKESLEYQCRSDVNLLVIGPKETEGGNQIFTGKIFEYMFAKRPILALVPRGVARDLIEEGKLGVTVDSDDVMGISNTLLELFRMWQRQELKLNPSPHLLKRYDRRELTRQLAGVFDGVLGP
ncbi:MAG: glycosyltransferase family 4 protein [Candidatus Hodarchaeota archaeon]